MEDCATNCGACDDACHMDFSDLDDAQLLDKLMVIQAEIREAGLVAEEIAAEMRRRRG